MTKVLFVAHTAAASGAELAAARLAKALRRRGVLVAAALPEDGPIAHRLRADGIETRILHGNFDSRALTIARHGPRRLFLGLASLIRLGWSLGTFAIETGATVVVAESSKSLIMGVVAARRAPVLR